MSKNIAFVGAFGTDCSILQMRASDLLRDRQNAKVTPLHHMTYVNSIKGPNEDYECYMYTSFARRMESLAYDEWVHVVADSWALYELACVMVLMKSTQEAIESSNQMLGPDGNPIFTEAHGKFIILQAAFQVLVNQVAIEKDFWDFLYYAPVYEPGDDELDEDGIAPKDRLYQKEVDIAIQSLIGQLGLNVVRLSPVADTSFEMLEAEKEKWVK